MNCVVSAFKGSLSCIVWIQARRVTDCGKNSGFCGCQLRRRFAEIKLGGSVHAVGIATKVCRVEIPLQDLRAPILSCDLRRKDSFSQSAAEGWMLIEEQKIEGE